VGRIEGRIVPFGEAALLVLLGNEIDPALSARVRGLAAAVRRLDDPALGAPVPGYASLLVPFDPLSLEPADAAARVRPLLRDLAADTAADAAADAAVHPLIELPTRYGGEDGPDLEAVAAAHDLRPADVVALHASVDYVVHFLGFAPGFAYLGAVPAAIATPRHARPRERVPAGSVGIADRQTAVYPGGTPGGWQLVGRTESVVWDARRDPPALLTPGARVRFVPLRA
jgi:KipI family sensor histidine kinase inhibitor